MKLIKRLPSVKKGRNVRAFGLYECIRCLKHERKRTDTAKTSTTNLCKSCAAKENATTHGHSYHPLYSTWKGQQKRCEDSKCKDYKYYGARGISFCTTWKSFEVWLAHISTLPKTKETSSLDRIDNDGNYIAGNLRWATCKEQANNRRSNLKNIKDKK